MLHLSEWLRWMILGSRTFLFNKKFQMFSLDNFYISQKRLETINNWIDGGIKIIYLKGSTKNVSREINKRFEKYE